MSIKVAVVGLGQTAISAAMALSNHSKEFTISGWDPDLDTRVTAERSNVFNPVCKKLNEAVRNAHIILFSLPADESVAVLKELNLFMQQGTVLLNMSIPFQQTNQWMMENLKLCKYFISLFPTINSKWIAASDFGTGTARADLFSGSHIFIADTGKTETVILDLAVDFVVLLGGQPEFISVEELDGLIAVNVLLPQLASAALMRAISTQPSWREGSHIAGSSLFHGSMPLIDMEEISGQSILTNRDSMLHHLEEFARQILEIRRYLMNHNSEGLNDYFRNAFESRERWLTARKGTEKPSKMTNNLPSVNEALNRILNLGK